MKTLAFETPAFEFMNEFHGFLSRYVTAICDQDGRNWKVAKPIDYIARDGRHFRIPVGAPTDGASTPAILWNKIPPFGDYWLPAVFHDSLYQNTAQIVTNGPGGEILTKAGLDKASCDSLLKEAMELCGVDQAMADVIYAGVVVGGAGAFKQDRS